MGTSQTEMSEGAKWAVLHNAPIRTVERRRLGYSYLQASEGGVCEVAVAITSAPDAVLTDNKVALPGKVNSRQDLSSQTLYSPSQLKR